MRIFRAITATLLALIFTVSIGFFVSLATFQQTLLNRVEVKSWLSSSGIYGSALSNIVQVDDSAEGDEKSLVTSKVLSNSLNLTFTPTYVQKHAERALDSTYDWLHGKSNTISFTIPIQQEKSAFIRHLTAQLQPKIAKLPVCGTSMRANAKLCIPPSSNPAQEAKAVATQVANSSDFLEKPITEKAFNGGEPLVLDPALQASVSGASLLVVALPIVAVAAMVGRFFLIGPSYRTARSLGRQLFFSTIFSFVLGLILLWLVGGNIQLGGLMAGDDPQQALIFSKLVDPVLQQALPALGKWLSIFSGAIALPGLIIWLTMRWKLKRQEESTLTGLKSPQRSAPPRSNKKA